MSQAWNAVVRLDWAPPFVGRHDQARRSLAPAAATPGWAQVLAGDAHRQARSFLARRQCVSGGRCAHLEAERGLVHLRERRGFPFAAPGGGMRSPHTPSRSHPPMFKQIVVVDKTGLLPWATDELAELSSRPLRMFEDVPASAEESVRRIGDADAVFVSWNTQLDASVLSQCTQLSYVGMCCSLYTAESANVDVEFANANNITVEGIRDYGDEGVIEFITAELIRLLKGLGGQLWREEPVELTGRKVGIIGLGTVGQLLASRMQTFGAEVFYFNRSRKPEAEQANINYLPLDQLLETVEIVSTHLPKNTCLLQGPEFDQLGDGKILVNTSLGLPFDQDAFAQWIAQPGNFSILDGDGAHGLKEELCAHPRVLHSPLVAGWTTEAKERLSEKVLANVRKYLRSIGNSR